MKTTYSDLEIELFLSENNENLVEGSVKQLAEGHSSQVFLFKTAQGSFVIRIRDNKKDFDADTFAYENFSNTIPIPIVIEIGSFDDTIFYAITPYISGETLNLFSSDAFEAILPKVRDVIAQTFLADISNTSGYGDPDFNTGNAPGATWQSSLKDELAALNIEKLRQSATNIGLPEGTVDTLVHQFNSNLRYVSEYRRLLHGDPGGDNVIINGNSVAALIDWEQMSYGDWLRDYSRFEFWAKNDYGNAEEFAKQYNLEADNVTERKAVYWAINALRGIEFADRVSSERLSAWLRANLGRIIL